MSAAQMSPPAWKGGGLNQAVLGGGGLAKGAALIQLADQAAVSARAMFFASSAASLLFSRPSATSRFSSGKK